MKKEFIGIDVSKLTLDVHLYFNKSHKVFSNDESGFKSMTKWIKQLVKDSDCSTKYCFEHTGIYSMALSIYLKDNNESFYMVSGLAVKRSMGLKRGKTDKTDAFALAKYLFQNDRGSGNLSLSITVGGLKHRMGSLTNLGNVTTKGNVVDDVGGKDVQLNGIPVGVEAGDLHAVQDGFRVTVAKSAHKHIFTSFNRKTRNAFYGCSGIGISDFSEAGG
jgi:hypothetical protein